MCFKVAVATSWARKADNLFNSGLVVSFTTCNGSQSFKSSAFVSSGTVLTASISSTSEAGESDEGSVSTDGAVDRDL
jgi:hypothetical protein